MLNFVIKIWRVSMRSRSSHHLLPDKMAPNYPVLKWYEKWVRMCVIAITMGK
jgi:hypothetical protein